MEKVFAKDRQEWRNWLEQNYDKLSEIYLVFYKLSTKKPTVTYEEAVEEALCFGWIDGIRKGIDDDTYMNRFTPRKPKSTWSVVNQDRVAKLIAAGKMTDAGMKLVEIAKQNGQWEAAYQLSAKQEIPKDLDDALEANEAALIFFKSLSNTNQFVYIRQIEKVKSPALRAERLERIIRLCERELKPFADGKKVLSDSIKL
ncbi:YdeI/OmpD-associated family protein [Adhaeribacter sp. BT258]|uniref:YdeI/OmpD-associated family protein n=1 Tax=Adhaeribacter terrigena TaxID=2793070 RepID=A0ABS1C250_9BACT|nr:YdeI/OmpD-associated family protein [Adhaeribacter terrigena]MBK0403474.1 YdeI/OmpD-associated family protein [Adhaeribacter terrigena]